MDLGTIGKVSTVELTEEFGGELTADLVCLSIEAIGGRTIDLPLVFFRRQAILERIVRGLREEAKTDSVLGQAASSRLGYALWSRIHRDIGTGGSEGQFAALANRKVFFKKFFRWLSTVSSPQDGDLWGVLESRGACLTAEEVPSFVEWKKLIHFGGVELPSRADVEVAKRFLDTCSSSLSEHEERHRHNGRWADRDELPSEFWKWLRKDSTRLARNHGLSDAQIHAATLLSFAYRVELGNHVAEQIWQRLPSDTLGETGSETFRCMWMVAEAGLDDRSRYDIPLMASPVLSSSIEYLAEVDGAGATANKENVLTDILSEIVGGIPGRTRGVNIALGFSHYYPVWLQQERSREREKGRNRLQDPARQGPARYRQEEHHKNDRRFAARSKKQPGQE